MSEQRFRSSTLHDGEGGAHDGLGPLRGEQFGQVLHFRLRPRDGGGPGSSTEPQQSLAEDNDDALARYTEERDDEPINYRQRMLMNVIAVAIVTLLVVIGVWLADIIVDLQHDQDCVLQGRSNCAPIEVPK
jgi:hypothetical protein